MIIIRQRMFADNNSGGFFNSVKTAYRDMKSALSPAALKSDFVDPAAALYDTARVVAENPKEAMGKVMGDMKGNSQSAGRAFMNDLRRVGRNKHNEEFKNYLINRYGKEHAEEVLKKNTKVASKRVGKSIAKTVGMFTGAFDGGALMGAAGLGDLSDGLSEGLSEGGEYFDEASDSEKAAKGVRALMKDYTPEQRVDAHYRMCVNPMERISQGLRIARSSGIHDAYGIGVGSGDHRAGAIPDEVAASLAEYYADKRYGGKAGVDAEVQRRIQTPEGQARYERYQRRGSMRSVLGNIGNTVQHMANKMAPMFGGTDLTARMDQETANQMLAAQRRQAMEATGSVVGKPFELVGGVAADADYYTAPARTKAWNFIKSLTKKKQQ